MRAHSSQTIKCILDLRSFSLYLDSQVNRKVAEEVEEEEEQEEEEVEEEVHQAAGGVAEALRGEVVLPGGDSREVEEEERPEVEVGVELCLVEVGAEVVVVEGADLSLLKWSIY